MDHINIVVGTVPADQVLLKLAASHKLPNIKSFRFTKEAETALMTRPIIAYVPKKDVKTTRIASSEDALSLLNSAMLISNRHLLSYLSNIPQSKQRDMELNFIFLPYSKEIAVTEHLDNMVYLSSILKSETTSGKIDYLSLEDAFRQTLGSKKSLSLYIPYARKHSYMNILDIKTRNSIRGGIKIVITL
jgi:hypothetical protein